MHTGFPDPQNRGFWAFLGPPRDPPRHPPLPPPPGGGPLPHPPLQTPPSGQVFGVSRGGSKRPPPGWGGGTGNPRSDPPGPPPARLAVRDGGGVLGRYRPRQDDLSGDRWREANGVPHGIRVFCQIPDRMSGGRVSRSTEMERAQRPNWSVT